MNDGSLTLEEVRACITTICRQAYHFRRVNRYPDSHVVWVDLPSDILARHSEENRRQLDAAAADAAIRIMWP